MLWQSGGVEISGNDTNKLKLHIQRDCAHITFGKCSPTFYSDSPPSHLLPENES